MDKTCIMCDRIIKAVYTDKETPQVWLRKHYRQFGHIITAYFPIGSIISITLTRGRILLLNRLGTILFKYSHTTGLFKQWWHLFPTSYFNRGGIRDVPV